LNIEFSSAVNGMKEKVIYLYSVIFIQLLQSERKSNKLKSVFPLPLFVLQIGDKYNNLLVKKY